MAADIATVVVALAALWVAVGQARLARKHNRLSVRPMLQLYRIWETNSHNSVIRFELVNNGLGPGRVTDIEVMDDKTAIRLDDSHGHKVDQVFARVIGPDWRYHVVRKVWPTGTWIKAGERVVIAEVVLAMLNERKLVEGSPSGMANEVSRVAELNDFIKHCQERKTNFTSRYSWESMYGESWSDDTIY